MAKSKYKKLLATGLAVAGVIQVGMTTPVHAAPKGIIIDCADIEKEFQSRLDSTGKYFTQVDKGENHNPDRNMQIVQDLSKSADTFYRFTHEDGTPYTGLYKSTYTDKGTGIEWLVLDEDGCSGKDPMKPHFAWLNGRCSADFLYFGMGPNLDKSTDRYYLTTLQTVEDAELRYIVFNDWLQFDGAWYRSNADGICYRNQWFKDTNGKWYYFGDDCKMVSNKLVDGYWVGADGALVQ